MAQPEEYKEALCKKEEKSREVSLRQNEKSRVHKRRFRDGTPLYSLEERYGGGSGGKNKQMLEKPRWAAAGETRDWGGDQRAVGRRGGICGKREQKRGLCRM